MLSEFLITADSIDQNVYNSFSKRNTCTYHGESKPVCSGMYGLVKIEAGDPAVKAGQAPAVSRFQTAAAAVKGFFTKKP
jgi:hypothetical protein